jgi:hypothetical protein
MALMFNMNRGKNQRPATSERFNPYAIADRKKRGANMSPMDLAMSLGIEIPEDVRAAAERRRNGGK